MSPLRHDKPYATPLTPSGHSSDGWIFVLGGPLTQLAHVSGVRGIREVLKVVAEARWPW